MTNIRRSIVKRLVRGQTRSSAVARLSSFGLDLMGYKGYRLSSVVDHGATRLDPVFGPSESQVAKPRPLETEVELFTRPLPPIQPLVIENVAGRSGSSFLYKGYNLLLPDEMYDSLDRTSLLTNSGFFFQDYFVTSHSQTAEVPYGICAFGHGDANWYHWLAEILPVVWLSRNLPAEFKDYPLLVPETALTIPSFRETLDLCRGDREVIGLRGDVLHRFDRLVHIPSPVSGPFNMRDHMWPEPEDYIQNVDVVRQVRHAVLENLGIERDADSPKRVFLVRPPRARSYNQEDIRVAAEARGFTAVQMEQLTFREQVSLMYNAEFVIGPTGAAFANTLFMSPGSQSLVWALQEYDGACFFSNLAHAAGCEMTYCFVEADTTVKSSYEAFAASYKLPVDTFCEHIDQLLENTGSADVRAQKMATQ
ncbi:glycosyltransferase family 61 protein [Tateyamaria omphalii]|uniref:glycosyltransferase family 61 protein n=1 Tax=Tateyamaria omphalii TaxID=299262 RepID=UPI001C99BA1E|nr:glycosyltransferase family 61 protein [Tateyamaria omphalii]MBY5934986.1 glycosyltransferase family 61 protein [Tateyamaria omphalii]